MCGGGYARPLGARFEAGYALGSGLAPDLAEGDR